MVDPGVGDLSLAAWTIVASAAFVVPVVFLALVGIAWRQRQHGLVGPRLTAWVALSGGASLGAMLLVTSDLSITWPIYAVGLVLVVGVWRRGRRAQAGWLLAGIALPWTLLWGWYTALLLGGARFDVTATLTQLSFGAVPLAVGLAIALRGDAPPPAPDIHAPPGQPGSRQFGSIAAAIGDASRVGPFSLPAILGIAAIVGGWIGASLVVPFDAPDLARAVIPAVAASILATEAYVRGWPSISRRAFEAFSWLGEWELARARELTGRGVPTSRREAEAWLASRPVRADELPLRIEILLFAARADEARTLVERLSPRTPAERFEAAALRDLVDWHAGGDGDLEGMVAAARELLPADGDDRLRAEVSIATTRVRRLMAGGVTDGATAVAPLLEVRERLGPRADGQIGRALRRRILPLFLVAAVVVAVAAELLTGTGAPPI